MYNTTSCNTQSCAPEDGRDHRPKHVELIGIINKPLLLHPVGVYIIYFSVLYASDLSLFYIIIILSDEHRLSLPAAIPPHLQTIVRLGYFSAVRQPAEVKMRMFRIP